MTWDVPTAQARDAASLYLAPLDGLRFFAFLLVFVHHLSEPLSTRNPMVDVQALGWVGVDLFLAISSYLFFHLLSAEYAKTGTINIRWFYIRRLLRIYPLMMLFPLAMLLLYGASDEFAWPRFVALGLFLDNLVSWFHSYNHSIPFSTHLWTLSYEFQFYLFLPLIFLAYVRLGKRGFLLAALAFYSYCFLARAAMFANGAVHPIIWVTPLFKPESLLVGMCLVVLQPTWKWWWSAIAAVFGAAVFVNLPLPWATAWSSAVSYPVIGLTCAAIIDASLRCGMLSKILSVRPLVMLGRVSFGLYVYHVLAIHLGLQATNRAGLYLDRINDRSDYLVAFLIALGITIVLATASYWLMERWFDRLKLRFAVVVGRI